ADRLRRDHAYRLTQLDHAARSQVTAVAQDADAALGFAGQHGTDLHLLDAGSLDGRSEFLGDLLVDLDDHLALVVLDLLERDAANDAVAQGLDDLAGFDDRSYVDAF